MVNDRRLITHCSLRLDIHYFLGYEVDEDLPCEVSFFGRLTLGFTRKAGQKPSPAPPFWLVKLITDWSATQRGET